MDYKKDWKDFQSLIDARPDYRRWLYCEDQEEKELWRKLLGWEVRINHLVSLIQRSPMPAETDGIHLSRSSLHIDQRAAISDFLELLFENCLRSKDDENLNLLFSFLETYSDLLERETKWCQ